MKVKKASEKVGLKLNIQKTKIMATGPITSWQIDGKQWKQWLPLFFWAPKSLQTVIAAMKLKDGCSWHLDSILKSRDITLPTKVCLVKAMVFSVGIYGCESWTIKKTECWRIDAFELWCWKRFLRVPWTTRRSNQSILKEIVLNIHWKDWCRSSNTLATWCEEPTYWKYPDAGKDWKQEKGTTEDEMVGWHHWLNGHEFWVNSGSWWWTGRPGVLQSMGS